MNILFDPLLVFHPSIAVFIFAAFMLFVINLCYRFLANQGELKRIKQRMAELSDRMKAEKDNKDSVNALLKESMTEQNKMMKITMKPMLVSLVLAMIFFPWAAQVYGDYTVNLIDSRGNITINGNMVQLQKTGDTLLLDSTECSLPCIRTNIHNATWDISSQGNAIKFARVVVLLPVPLPFVDYNDMGWLGWYLVISVPVMVIIRKMLKVNM